MTIRTRSALRPRAAAPARPAPAFMPFFALALFAALLAAVPAVAEDGPVSDDEKAFYAIGANQARALESLGSLSKREQEMFIRGLRDALDGKELAVSPEQGNALVQAMVQARREALTKAEREAGAAFAAEQAKREGAVTTESGLVFIETEPGSGDSPSPTDKVRVHYHGTLRDGTVFDSSVERGQPAEFPLNRVIPCWTEGVAMMKVGGKATLICPADIAYGDKAQGRIPAGATLRFDVELIDIVK